MGRSIPSLLLLLFVIGLSACPKAKNVVEACEQYKRLKHCESRLQEWLPEDVDCEALKPKFEYVCTQEEIDFAHKTFKKYADELCPAKNKKDISKIDLSVFKGKISKRCSHANVKSVHPLETIDEL